MSGISVGDVVSAIKLAMIIYDKWFVKVNRADARYMDFGNDIRFLQSQLTKLRKIFEETADIQRQDALRKGGGIHGSLTNFQALEAERIDLIGNFHKTLKDCQKLLEENVRYSNSSNGMVLTARWYGTGIESESVFLRQRLQFHCTKITFIIQPLQLQLLASIDRSVQTLKRQNREQLRILRNLSTNGLGQAQIASDFISRGLSPVPASIAERYQYQALSARPFNSSETFPLKESVNALLYHFGQSTVQVPGGLQIPTNDHFNNLLKARWMLAKILQSPAFRRLGPCLYRATVESIEDELECQYERFEESWDEVKADSLSKLGDEHFSIWVVEEAKSVAPLVTDEGAGEIKILELPLSEPPGISKQSLLVFRQSDTEFRILRTSIIEGGNLVIPTEKQIVNMHHFRFVPFYAVPNSGETRNSVWICHNQVHHGEIFDMTTLDDVFAFQRALTGYEVVFNNSRTKWEMQREGFTNRTMRTESWSGVQIWHWNPLGRIQNIDNNHNSNEAMSGSTSGAETRAAILADEVVLNLPERAASVVSASPMNGAGSEELLASSAPKVPIMVICTYWKDKLSFFHIPLDRGMAINLRRCGCSSANSTCLHTVIERDPIRKFGIKIHSVDNQGDQPILADWDLALLGQPRHPKFDSLETVNNIMRLDLEFEKLEDRKIFQIQLIRTIKGYQKNIDDFGSVAKTLRHLDQRPNVLNSPRRLSGSTLASRRASIVGLSPPSSPNLRTASMSSSSSLSTDPASDSMALPSPNAVDPYRGRLRSSSPLAQVVAESDSTSCPQQASAPRRGSTMTTFVASPMSGLSEETFSIQTTLPSSNLEPMPEENEFPVSPRTSISSGLPGKAAVIPRVELNLLASQLNYRSYS